MYKPGMFSRFCSLPFFPNYFCYHLKYKESYISRPGHSLLLINGIKDILQDEVCGPPEVTQKRPLLSMSHPGLLIGILMSWFMK